MDEYKGVIIHYTDNKLKIAGYLGHDGTIVNSPKKALIHTMVEAEEKENIYQDEEYNHIDIRPIVVTLYVND